MGPTLRKADIATGGIEFFALPHGFKSFPRGPVLEVLLDSIDKNTCNVVTGKILIAYTFKKNDIVTLHFFDGTTTEADILIGADGIHSVVRRTMFPERPDLAKPHFSGQFAHRMMIPQKALLDMNPLHPALSGFKFVSESETLVADEPADTFSGAEKGNTSTPCSRQEPYTPQYTRTSPLT